MIRIILITYCITFYYLHSIHAAVFNIPNGDVAALISAINSCNTNGEADVINLAVNGTYIFSSANHETFISVNGVYTSHGFTALPRIENTDWPTQQTLDLTIEGNGSTFIRSSTDFFRFIYIHTTATVIVKNLNFRGGKGRYKGGAIFSGWRSMLTIENCRFDSNSTYDNLGTFDQGGGAVMISS